jgi:transcriptional regulator with XRE-family HTH domain
MKNIQGVDVKMIAQMIEERIDTLDTHISWADIAKTLDLTKSAISKFKNNGTELGFESLLKLSKLLYHKNYKEVMSEWCTKIRKPSNVRFALEYLSANRRLNQLETLIKEISSSNSKLLIEMAEVYSILFMNHKGDFNESYITKANSLNPKSTENKVLLAVGKVYYYNKKGNIKEVSNLLDAAEKDNESVEDSFLQNVYQHRIDEMRSVSLLFGEVSNFESRLYAEKLLNNDFYCDTFKADSYYRIGMSYLFESPDMCLANLQKAMDHYDKDNIQHLSESTREHSVTLAKIYWGQIKDSSELSNASSIAHYEAKYGDKEKAIAIIEELDDNSAFTKYYEGIAKNDYNILLESLLMFVNNGNRFYAKLPLEILQQHPPLKNVVELILNNGGTK